ncbi:MAG: aldehyde ferredoxin oxidoreductase family protein [Chloroflexota bacterium]
MSILGSVLTVDLTSRQHQISALDEVAARQYLGGRGLNIWQMQELIGPDVDPLGPDNVLVLSGGLLTGTAVPASSRLHFGARSPMTNALGSSNVGGHFGAALHAAGFQAARIRGRADRPVYLWIGLDGVELREAGDLWGLDTRATAERLRELHPDADLKVLMIGVAGENVVRYACINTGDGHAAGRTGLGAVMGSKKLKAIVIEHHPERELVSGEVRELSRQYALAIRNSERYEMYSTYSNSAYLNWANEIGILGTRNFQDVQFEGAEKIDGSQLQKYVHKAKSCHRCPVHCKAEIRIDHGRFARLVGERPDIEPLMAFGPKIGVDDPEAVLYLYALANTLGIDVISTGGVLAFAIDLYQRGLLTDEDTGGLALEWGDAGAMAHLMRQIAEREGLGDVLAEGVRLAAERIGRGSEQYAYHSKGMELPGYDPRGAQGTALGYAISNRGADFTSVYTTLEFRWTPEQGREVFGTEKAVDRNSSEGKGVLVRHVAIVSAILDSLGICKVPALSVVGDFSLQKEAGLAAALSGWDLTAEELFEAGLRIVNAERRFNLACGLSSRDDDLPDKFVEERVPSGPTQGKVVDLGAMLRDFYAAMGWDEEGRPPDPE